MFIPRRKIILTGYRATGKTLVGLMLAEHLNLDFMGMDEMLEARAGQTIRQIVAQQGWGQFRLLERDLLAEMICRKDAVISTGGGAILHQKIWNLLRQTGLVVWLTADIDTICRRLAKDEKSAGQRPSLTKADITDHGANPQRSNNHGTNGHRVPQVATHPEGISFARADKLPSSAISGTAMRTFVREPNRSPQDVVPCDRLQADIYLEVAQVLAEREPLYKKGSHLTVDTSNKTAGEIVHLIELALGDDEFLRTVETSLPKDPIYC